MTYFKDRISKEVRIQDKDKAVADHVDYMLSRTAVMFSYEGLPETIPERSLELQLQTNGNCFITEVEGSLYSFVGGLGGEPDVYYEPTIYTIANPALKFSASRKIGVDGVLGRNDTMMRGLLPLIKRNAYLMAENELSIWVAEINERIVSIITADNENTRAAAEEYLKRIYRGEIGVIMGMGLVESLHTNPFNSTASNSITQLIELEQYLKASLYNDLGLNANYNMKRESLSMTESQMNHDALLPLVDDMLRQRELMCEAVNEMYGTDISVRLSSSWEALKETVEQDPEEAEAEGGEEDDAETGISGMEE